MFQLAGGLFASFTPITRRPVSHAGEHRYDIGNYQSYFETFIEFALADPQHGPRLRERLKTLLERD